MDNDNNNTINTSHTEVETHDDTTRKVADLGGGAAMGAITGAVVGGPVGAVAGAAIGGVIGGIDAALHGHKEETQVTTVNQSTTATPVTDPAAPVVERDVEVNS